MHKRLKQISNHYAASKSKHVQLIRRVSKKPLFTVPIATFMVLLLVVMVAFLVAGGGRDPQLKSDDSNVVIISYDKQENTIPTRAKNVGDLLKRLEIKLHSGDVVEPAEDTEIIGDNFRVNVYRAVPVTIVDGGKKTFTYSAAATPRSIVKQAGVEVYPEDILELLPTENFLQESSIGERVVIDRATPVHVNLYGTKVVMRTHAETVGDLLKEKNITMDKDDSVQPTAETKLAVDSQVFLVRKGTKIVTEEREIPVPIETIQDSSLTFGTSVVRQQGTPGKKLITYQLILKNGKEVSRKPIQQVIVAEPVKQVVARGRNFNIATDKASVLALAGVAQSDYPYADYVIEHESHWNPAAMNSAGCAGLGQACPGSKLARACANWQTDPVCQMRFFHGYAIGRYGTWSAAYNFKVANGWW